MGYVGTQRMRYLGQHCIKHFGVQASEVEDLYQEDGGPEIQGLGNRVWVEDEQAHRLVTFRIEGCTPLGGAVIWWQEDEEGGCSLEVYQPDQ